MNSPKSRLSCSSHLLRDKVQPETPHRVGNHVAPVGLNAVLRKEPKKCQDEILLG